jgi:hypothetical protein
VDLVDVYEAVVPSIVALIAKMVRRPAGQDREPLMPAIIGTGFLVNDSGLVATNRHVADLMRQVPPHPTTGAPGYGAVMFDMSKDTDGAPCMRWMLPEIASVGMLSQFSSDSIWYGEAVPDIAFVQLQMRGTPFLKLANDEFYIRPGMPIATAGFPMGNVPLIVMQKVNQVTPFIRRGIVSSVFPFSIPRPHGLTIDIMQQGGSSGSPIFYEHEATVVGMMAAGMLQGAPVPIGNCSLTAHVPTNISIAVSAHMIGLALPTFLESEFAVDTSGFPTLAEWQQTHDATEELGWDTFPL